MEKIPNLVIVLNLLFSRYHFVFSCSSLRALCIGSFSYFFAWRRKRKREYGLERDERWRWIVEG
jgi:hypothetical protein